MRWFVLLLSIFSCAHQEMNLPRATQLCRNILGPSLPLPKLLEKHFASAKKDAEDIINGCYREHLERTHDPRDYISCAMVTYSPKSKPVLTILSPKEFIPPEIFLQCARQKFSKLKKFPPVSKQQSIELVFYHFAVTKD